MVRCALGAAALFTLYAALPCRAEPTAADPCVKWSTETRFNGVAYDHLVHLSSACKLPMTCQVETNINPDPIRVELKPEGREDVLTTRGSPAREFTAKVECKEK